MFAMVLEVIPPHKIGQAMGVAALVIMFAPAIGPTLAGFLIGTLSWRWVEPIRCQCPVCTDPQGIFQRNQQNR